MKTATGLAIVAVGAILAFAVTGHPGWLNVQAAGWVLILVGLAGCSSRGAATAGCGGGSCAGPR